MNDLMTGEDIQTRVPAEFRQFFAVSSLPLPREMWSIVDAFCEAVRCITPALWFSHRVHIFFAAAPFSVKLSNGELTYRPYNSQLIGVHVEHLIFLDCNRLAPLKFQIQVACILEELVHSLMHITDEQLVSVVVAWLYRGVVLVDGKYTPIEPVVSP